MATATIPIVFLMAGDPVAIGLVASLNRPRRNVTGVTALTVELGPMQLELLHELVPTATVMALLVNPTAVAVTDSESRDLPATARRLGLQLHVLNASSERDFDKVFATMVQLGAGGLVIGGESLFTRRSEHHCRPGAIPCAARHLPISRVCSGGWADQLRRQSCGWAPSGWRLHRPDYRGRAAGQPADSAVHQSGACHQPQDNSGDETHDPAICAGARR
jgi:hypothetical protein